MTEFIALKLHLWNKRQSLYEFLSITKNHLKSLQGEQKSASNTVNNKVEQLNQLSSKKSNNNVCSG